MRNPARIKPIKDLLVKSKLFTKKQLAWRSWDLRLAQYLINEWLVFEHINKYYYYDECWVTMEKLWFKRRDFAIWWSYWKEWDQPLTRKIIREMDTDHIKSVIEHISEKIDDELSRYSPRLLEKFKEELEYRNEFNYYSSEWV